jgi:hypothetical protein
MRRLKKEERYDKKKKRSGDRNVRCIKWDDGVKEGMMDVEEKNKKKWKLSNKVFVVKWMSVMKIRWKILKEEWGIGC